MSCFVHQTSGVAKCVGGKLGERTPGRRPCGCINTLYLVI